MQGLPIQVQKALEAILTVEGVRAVKVVPPAGIYTLHVELEKRDMESVTAFYRRALVLPDFNQGAVQVQAENPESFRWITGLAEIKKEDRHGRGSDLDVPVDRQQADQPPGAQG